MLYKTHQRYGLLSGLLGIPLLISVGLLPVITLGMRFTDAVLVILLLTYAMISALFGSEFPDCDSYGGKMENGEMKKGSIPSQKHPMISAIFRFCGVKHRGKFSHDYASILVFFGIIYAVQHFLFMFLQKMLEGAKGGTTAFIIQAFGIYLLVFLSRELAIKYRFIKKNRKKPNIKMIYISMFVGIFLFLYLVTLALGFTSLNLFSVAKAFNTLNFVRAITRIIVIFTFIGAYSHLYADMLTNEGVSIFGIRLSPAKFVIKMNKLFFLPSLLFGGLGFYLAGKNGLIAGAVLGAFIYFSIKKTDLKTGSAYEDACFLIVTILCIPATVLAIISITGGDVGAFLTTIGLLK